MRRSSALSTLLLVLATPAVAHAQSTTQPPSPDTSPLRVAAPTTTSPVLVPSVAAVPPPQRSAREQLLQAGAWLFVGAWAPMFATSVALSAGGSAALLWTAIPVVAPFVFGPLLAMSPNGRCTGTCSPGGSPLMVTLGALVIVDGLAQLAGVAMLIASASVRERPMQTASQLRATMDRGARWVFAPSAPGTLAGVSLTMMHF